MACEVYGLSRPQPTHHFAADEIQKLLEDHGFREIRIEENIEASSKRPD